MNSSFKIFILSFVLIAFIHLTLPGNSSSEGFKNPHQPQVNIPYWVIDPPKHGYVGISKPCDSIASARKQALDSAIVGILQAMGGEYNLKNESTLVGDLRSADYTLNEKLNFSGNWFLQSIQQNIKACRFEKHLGKNLCFLLVELTPKKLGHFKKLTIGPKVSAKMVRFVNAGLIEIQVMEINDVVLSLTGYDMAVITTNRNAKLISLFAWKVPQVHVSHFSGIFNEPLNLKNNSKKVVIPLNQKTHDLKSIVLGRQFETDITLTGHDETGRRVSVPVLMALTE